MHGIINSAAVHDIAVETLSHECLLCLLNGSKYLFLFFGISNTQLNIKATYVLNYLQGEIMQTSVFNIETGKFNDKFHIVSITVNRFYCVRISCNWKTEMKTVGYCTISSFILLLNHGYSYFTMIGRLSFKYNALFIASVIIFPATAYCVDCMLC